MPSGTKRKQPHFWGSVKKYANKAFLIDLCTNPCYLKYTCWLLLALELFLNIFVIEKVNYTEIDWIAYMQEVDGFLNGTLDYQHLKGDTGPLVYPAGFVYIYSALYFVTSHGRNIRLAQYIFLGLYLAQMSLVFRLYTKAEKLPPYALAFLTLTSYRIHSIYVLRLFNDPIAVLLFYASLNLFLANRWSLGSVVYSLAVSVKMNILLYAPCLLVAYLTNLGPIATVAQLAVCAAVQLVLGAPFLYANPVSYLRGSFDIGRVFEHKWTVNYRFLTRQAFENRYFHIVLLGLHLYLLFKFLPFARKYLESYAKLNSVRRDLDKSKNSKVKASINFNRNTQLFLLPFFVTNLIGVACARSLHYQFYCWYFHSLVYLGFCTKYSKTLVFCLLGVIELCWNTYPSTHLSSVLLHVCHATLLIGVYKYTN
ncbi:lethal(2)neighbour of tid protein isoform X1 [Photinus pyralis]|uniref:dolichyl-P-Man:Man5GlcNAc2-PP-dolichol alpha-1,3-mannosyltransferase n=1 Tax=Photinus pyralis TaxID=7054 RepID=A0A1Y1LWR5_PHOPY|nr:lethal(2)neighbour of tid protein isoform X1 [Photinus pyralis]